MHCHVDCNCYRLFCRTINWLCKSLTDTDVLDCINNLANWNIGILALARVEVYQQISLWMKRARVWVLIKCWIIKVADATDADNYTGYSLIWSCLPFFRQVIVTASLLLLPYSFAICECMHDYSFLLGAKWQLWSPWRVDWHRHG